jgi:starch phosphorylase
MIEPGVNPRKWIHCCNRDLSKLITQEIGDESEWLKHLNLIKQLKSQIQRFKGGYVPEDSFFGQFMAIRIRNKEGIVEFMRGQRKDPLFLDGFDLKTTMFEGYLRKILESSRHMLLITYIIDRYLHIKTLTPEQKKNVVPRVIFIGGSPRPGKQLFLQMMKFMNQLARLFENDVDTNKLLRLVLMLSHNNTKESFFIPGLDVHNQLTMPGRQACTSQPIKFTMNGSLMIGSKDATNVRI